MKKLKEIRDRFWNKRSYYLPGMIAFFVLFAVSMTLNFSVSYMGNTSERMTDLILRSFWLPILLQVLKVVLIYLVIGGTLGALFHRGLLELRKRFGLFRSGMGLNTANVGVLLLFTFFLFSQRLIVRPQLYLDNFASLAGAFQGYLHFLTDRVSPVLFDVLILLLLVPFLVLAILSFDWKGIVSGAHQQLKSFRYTDPLCLIIILLAAASLLYEGRHLFPGRSSPYPNILILASDALRPDHFSGNGYHRDTTPCIDRLMKESLQIKGVMTSAPRTFPAWVSFFTSRYPMTHEVKHMFPRTRERNQKFETACTILNGLGYETSVVSDFAGDIFPRIELGFKRVLAPDMNFDILIRQIILEKQTFLLPFVANRWGSKIFPELRDVAKFPDEGMITAETIGEMERSRGKPFFITAFYSITHFPFSAPYPYYRKYTRPDYIGPYKYHKEIVLRIETDRGTEAGGIRPGDKEQIVALYDGCLSLFDREAGRIIEYLEERELLKNTIVLVTADHGENLYEKDFGLVHGEHLKGNLSLEVPVIIRHAGRMAGATLHKTSSIIDLMPTLFAMAGVPVPASFEGESLLPVKGKPAREREIAAYCETGIWFDNNKSTDLFFQHMRIDYPDIVGLSEVDTHYRNEIMVQQRYQNVINGAKYRTIYSGRYKLIYMPMPEGPRYELYDHTTDPYNQADLSKTRGDVLEAMKAKLYRFMDDKSAGNFIIKNGFLMPVFFEPIF
jgi:arylsulfatase A-like enzyme